ncbi:dipeptide epimerase [Taibaiella lutea]|uniref:Dipeptide epimerase n=1 Tax=Taibaiella lutea TaxID=2608001 RepID=A0A5M6CQM3_9BACT|nr:dipeptide epimerase [Taibaiella lutea]KAA5537427.1 dipeptide epimerase [Taibaiella lutea]
MLQLKYQSYDLPFEYPFAISKGLKTHQPTLILSLSLGRMVGYGETTSIGYYNADVDEMIVLLEKNRSVLEKYALNGPERFWHFLHHLFPGQNFLISALDMAGWDLYAQLNRRPLYSLIGLQWKNIPLTDYTIGINSPEEIAERVKVKPSPIYKLKVGSENDLSSLEALRKATDAIIRIDANEAWTIDQLEKILPLLEEMKIELIEQPLDRNDIEGMKKLKTLTQIPIIADEACREEKDAEACLELYDGINIKLSKCGGITPALNMIRAAKKAKKKIMLGGMCETIVGATALAHLLPLANYADIDGPLLLAENIGKGLTYDNGLISVPMVPGMGVSM